MKNALTRFGLAAVATLVLSATPAVSAGQKTWYVYCEGTKQGDRLVVFSENFWQHPVTKGYAQRVSSIAKGFFEARHNVRLDGCAAVNFFDFKLAEHSRDRTAKLHRGMGDRVFYFVLPDDVLPVE